MSAAPITAAASWIERAARVTPGGVHSPVRAFRAMGVPPLAIVEANGATLRDAEGREYIDWIGAWGPALLGHAHADVVRAVERAARRGLLFGLASPAEIELAERVCARVPGCEQLRFVATGTEATMSAVRVARAATRRATLIKFAGCYHGHADSFLVSAGSGAATFGVPDSPGVTAGAAGDTRVARFNDLESVGAIFAAARDQVAAVIVEPVVGNMGCVPPESGFLAGLRRLCDENGALLILDEVMTGFRVARGGAASRYGVRPDLIALGKVLGGGMPLAAFGGRRDLMGMVSPAGPVYQAGTFAAHPISIAAGLATFDVIDSDREFYDRLEAAGQRLEDGLVAIAAQAARDQGAAPVQLQRVGSMWTAFFSARPVRSWDDAEAVDRERFAYLFRAMLERGVLLPPSPFESCFLSTAHGDREIDRTLEAARAAFAAPPTTAAEDRK
jgi:glutamate-1-semialdehyde 2,1-aminomutase